MSIQTPVPHANIYSLTTQTCPSANTKYPVCFDQAVDLTGFYYKSNTVTISQANPGVVTWAAHGLLVGTPVKFTTDGALPTGLTAGTVYYIAAVNAGDFTVSATREGAAIQTTSAGSGTHTCTVLNRLYAYEPGDYLVTMSALFDATSNTAVNLNLWLDQDGSNVTDSNTQCTMNSQNEQMTMAVSFIIDWVKDGYIRWFYQADQTNARLLTVAASGNYPACPSIVMTVNKIGA